MEAWPPPGQTVAETCDARSFRCLHADVVKCSPGSGYRRARPEARRSPAARPSAAQSRPRWPPDCCALPCRPASGCSGHNNLTRTHARCWGGRVRTWSAWARGGRIRFPRGAEAAGHLLPQGGARDASQQLSQQRLVRRHHQRATLVADLCGCSAGFRQAQVVMFFCLRHRTASQDDWRTSREHHLVTCLRALGERPESMSCCAAGIPNAAYLDVPIRFCPAK